MDLDFSKYISEILILLVCITIIISVIATILYTKTKLSKEKLIDPYRNDLEYKIYKLEKELITNRERFQQMNHLVLDSQANSSVNYKNIEKTTNIKLFEDLDIDHNIEVQKNLIFVLTPFNKQFEDDYKIIKNTCLDFGFDCKRGDEEMVANQILKHILSQILKSRLIIVNISGRNPNVMYELGICQALGKPVLLICQSDYEIPFDLSSTRILIYKNLNDLNIQLKKWIVQTILND